MGNHAPECRIFQDEDGFTEAGQRGWARYILRGGLFLGLLHWGGWGRRKRVLRAARAALPPMGLRLY